MRSLGIAFACASAAVVLPIVVWWAAWHVHDPDQPWENAPPEDCRLMAEAMQQMASKGFPGNAPLMSQKPTGGPCAWSALGVSRHRVTMATFRAAAGDDLNGHYIEHVAVSRPSYSLFRLRALIEVGHRYGPEGGDGFNCEFRRGFAGWTLRSCTRAWIS